MDALIRGTARRHSTENNYGVRKTFSNAYTARRGFRGRRSPTALAAIPELLEIGFIATVSLKGRAAYRNALGHPQIS